MAYLVKGIKGLLAITLGVPLALYTLLAVINVFDEEKSTLSIKFEQSLAKIIGVDDKENAFIYTLGIAADENEDIYEVGQQRVLALNAIKTSTAELPYKTSIDIPALQSRVSDVLSSCSVITSAKTPTNTKTCQQSLIMQGMIINQLLVDSEILLTRYQLLASKNKWSQPVDWNIYNSSMVSRSHLSLLQRLLMLKAWQQALLGNSKEVAQLLTQDSLFWRKVLSSSRTLIDKMFAVALLKNHFSWASMILNNLSDGELSVTVPENWRQSLTKKERSFNKVVLGEWRYGQDVLLSFENYNSQYMSERLLAFFIKPFYQQQASINLYAEQLLAQASDIDNSDFKNTMCRENFSFTLLTWYSYNPVGKVMLCSGTPSFISYKKQIDELDMIRINTLEKY